MITDLTALCTLRLLPDLAQVGLINFNAQSWPLWHGDTTIRIQDKGCYEETFADQGLSILARIIDFVVLLYQKVGQTGIKLDRRRQRYFGKASFGNRGNLLTLGDAACVC